MPATRKHVLNIRRFVAGTLVVICICVNILAAVYVTREHKLIEDTISHTTREHGRAWAQLCKDRLQANDSDGLQNVIAAIGGSESILLAMVSDEHGLILMATDPQWVGKDYRVEHDLSEEGELHIEELHPEPTGFFHESGHTFELFFPIDDTDEHLGQLIVHINTAWGNKQAKALALKWMLLVLVLTTVVGLAAIGLDRRIRRAVQALIAATEAIALGKHIPEVHIGTGDDLDILGDSVKQIAGALQDTEERVNHWRQQLETTIHERTTQLEESQQLLAEREKIAAIGLMAAGIVHEIGNPLAAMSAIVQRIERAADPIIAKKCVTLRAQIERITNIISEMRQVASPVSTNGSVTNVNETLNVAVKITRYDPRAKTSKIVTDLNPDIPRVPGHPDRWQQVFLNLIMNALDAMPNGGCLSISSSIDGEQVVIGFRDTGDGMSNEQVRRLYHPFYTTKGRGGMGLGLTVCYSIIQSYGGNIQVSSVIGKGTDVRIIIPPFNQQSRSDVSKTPDGQAVSKA